MFWKRLSDPRPRLHDSNSRVGFIEQLESRWVPAALSDLTPTIILGPDFAEPGSKIPVEIRVDNQSDGRSKRFEVQYRLSVDEIADEQDILLGTAKHKGIGIQGSAEWSKTFKLPSDIAAGKYHLIVGVDPANKLPEANETNNQFIDPQTITVARTALTGKVKFEKLSRPVEIIPLSSSTQFIDPSVATWIVIHGRNQSSTSPNIQALAQQIDQYQPGDQVLMLDWSKAAFSGVIGGKGEDFILPVAAWAAEALATYGFSGDQLNLVGYSWGPEIAAEMAEVIGTVNSILAIDPARDFPGGSYNPESDGQIDLSEHANHAWAFLATAGLQFGSPSLASTAQTAIVVTGVDHFGIVTLVTELLALSPENPAGSKLPLGQLLTGLPASAWDNNRYSSTGVPGTIDGQFEIVLRAKSGEVTIESLSFFVGGEEQTFDA